MKKNEKHTKFALTDELISETLELVKLSDEKSIVKIFSNYHHADIAEILEELIMEATSPPPKTYGKFR